MKKTEEVEVIVVTMKNVQTDGDNVQYTISVMMDLEMPRVVAEDVFSSLSRAWEGYFDVKSKEIAYQ